MKASYPDISKLNGAVLHVASSEQVQNWNYNSKLTTEQQAQVLSLFTTIANADIPALGAAVEMLIKRHESLRTCFQESAGNIKQCVVPYSKEVFSPSCFDLSDEADAEKIILERNDQCRQQLRNISIPPLIRCNIFKVAENVCYFYLFVHHIISDAWSMRLVRKELDFFYKKLKNGETPVSEPLQMQLKDYASWQKKWLERNREIVCRYWAHKLSQLPENVSFEKIYESYERYSQKATPHNIRTGPYTQNEFMDILAGSEAAAFAYIIDSRMYSRLLELALACRVSLGTVLNASLQFLFYALTGKEKVLLAMPVNNRYRSGTASLIGCLVGGAYLYQWMGKGLTVKDFIGGVHIDFLKALRYPIYNHDEAQLNEEALRVNCDVFVNYQSKEIIGSQVYDERDIGHQKWEPEYYALSYVITENSQGLLCKWLYNTTLYAPEVIEFITEWHKAILEAMCRHADRDISEIAMELPGWKALVSFGRIPGNA